MNHLKAVYLFTIFILNFNGFASLESKGEKQCKSEIETCSLSLSKDFTINGVPGPKGDKGDPGLPGLHGPEGRRGSVGRPGSCRCVGEPTDPSDYDYAGINGEGGGSSGVDIGTVKEAPLASCKYASLNLVTGKYWVGREQNPFQVICDMETNLTCLITAETKLNKMAIENKSLKHGDKKFWLSERPKAEGDFDEYGSFDLEEFYGYNMNQLKYLQQQSSFVTQKIRYHCKNSQVSPDKNEHKALNLLTWNEAVIGPNPTRYHPLHYNIDYDGCKGSGTGWNYTDISVMAGHGRLPVIDFLIQDIRDGDQQFYLELKELCFG